MKKYFLALFILVFVACSDSSNEAHTIISSSGDFKSLKAKASKDYDLLTTSNETISFRIENEIMIHKSIKNKYVLINFWATWCNPCKYEIPILNKIYENKKNKLEIIGILFNDPLSTKDLEKFMLDYKMQYPITVSHGNTRLAKQLDNVQMIPESFLYSPSGEFIKKFVGEIKEEEFLKYIK